jgi:hypothetical protein
MDTQSIEHRIRRMVEARLETAEQVPGAERKKVQLWQASGALDALYILVTERMIEENPSIPSDLLNAYQDESFGKLHTKLTELTNAVHEKE